MFLVSVDFGYAQQSKELTVPEGTIAHLAEEPIIDIEYSPDGKLLAAASDSGIWLYDTVTHQEVTHLVGHQGLVNSISFSPDSKKLASGDSRSYVYLWDIATGKLLRRLVLEPFYGGTSVSFSPGGKTVACARVHLVSLWDGASHWSSRALSLDSRRDVLQSISFNPDGRMVATGNVDGRVFLFDVRSGRIRHTLEGHTYDVSSVSFRPDGRILASAGDQTVRLWSVITGEHLRTLHGHTGFVNSVSFSPDGKTLASAGSDGKILLWSVGWPAADVNRDNTVNILDLVLIANEFGKIGENEADVNGDGIVNILDLVAVAATFG